MLCLAVRALCQNETEVTYVASRRLSTIPDDIPHNVTSLTINPNNLRFLERGDLIKFIQLQYLDLSRGQISRTDSGSFIGLRSLQSLYLFDNKIMTIKYQTWTGLDSLKVLDVGWNRIDKIESTTWTGVLTSLEELYLDHNWILFVGPRAFHSLRNLRVLHLHNNRLSTLDLSVIRPVPPDPASLLPTKITLSFNNLQRNVFECNEILTEVEESKYLVWDRNVRVRPGLRPAPTPVLRCTHITTYVCPNVFL